jgi:hypothetical protein
MFVLIKSLSFFSVDQGRSSTQTGISSINAILSSVLQGLQGHGGATAFSVDNASTHQQQEQLNSLQILTALLVLLVSLHTIREQATQVTRESQPPSSAVRLHPQNPSSSDSRNLLTELASTLSLLTRMQNAENAERAVDTTYISTEPRPSAEPRLSFTTNSIASALGSELEGVNFRFLSDEQIRRALTQYLSRESSDSTTQPTARPPPIPHEETAIAEEDVPEYAVTHTNPMEQRRRIPDDSQSQSQSNHQRTPQRREHLVDPLLAIARAFQSIYRQRTTSHTAGAGTSTASSESNLDGSGTGQEDVVASSSNARENQDRGRNEQGLPQASLRAHHGPTYGNEGRLSNEQIQQIVQDVLDRLHR